MQDAKNGRVRDFVAVGDVEIKAIGADEQILDSEVPVRQILEQVVAKTGIPPFMVLVGPDGVGGGSSVPAGAFCAAALAGAVAGESDPAIPLNGTVLYGLNGLSASYSDNDIDALVQGGVTPLESTAGVIAPVRCVTTKTTSGGAADAT